MDTRKYTPITDELVGRYFTTLEEIYRNNVPISELEDLTNKIDALFEPYIESNHRFSKYYFKVEVSPIGEVFFGELKKKV